MFKQTTFISFLIFLLSATKSESFAQRIAWHADSALKWTDFRGSKPRRTRFAAATFSTLSFQFRTNGRDSFDAKVDCMFDPKRSWKRSRNLKPYLLKHEQTHFDITELYARKMRQSFAQYKAHHKYNSNTSFRVHMMYLRNNRRWRRCERRYDRETKHSVIKQEQDKWNIKIAEELGALREYEVK